MNQISHVRLYNLDEEDDEQGAGFCGWLLIIISGLVMVLTFPYSLLFVIKVVMQYERAIIFRLGKLRGSAPRGPGILFLLSCVDTMKKIDLRTITYDMPLQQMITKDAVTLSMDAVVFFKAQDPTLVVLNIVKANKSTELLAQTTLRNVVGASSLSELLANREAIAERARQVMEEQSGLWGIKIQRLEIKDIRLPHDLQKLMAAEAEAQRRAKALVVLAEGEHRASQSLKLAADIIASSPTAIQLKYLQTLNTIGETNNTTIVFPIPMEAIRSILMQ